MAIEQFAFNPDKTNGVGFQLAGMDPNAYKNFTSYGNAIGSGMNEEAAKRQAFDDNGYANYNYDGSQRGSFPAPALPPTPAQTNQESMRAAQLANNAPIQPTPAPSPVQSGGAGGYAPQQAPAAGIGGTNTGARSMVGMNNTYRGPTQMAGFADRQQQRPMGSQRGQGRGFQWRI